MSLPLRDDLECVLEDFSRMRRLGRFREALDLFDEQLAHFIDNRYVLVQYGLCLYEAGHIARLSELADKHRPSRRPKDALQLCWTLLVSVADVVLPDMEPNMRFDDIVPTIAAMLTGSWPGLSSVEVQILVLMYKHSDTSLWLHKLPSDWSSLYNHLLAEGMVWEFNDVFHQLITYQESLDGQLPIETSLRLLLFPYQDQLQSSLADSFDRLCKDWEEDIQDESTSFVIMDIFTTMGLMYSWAPNGSDGKAQACMAVAGERAAKLIAQDGSHAMSRPYLRWTMAKLLTTMSEEAIRKNLVFRGFASGKLKWFRNTFPNDTLPVYIPDPDEPDQAPQWKPITTRTERYSVRGEVQTVLRAAEELGDVEVQAACFRSMLLFGLEPPDIMVDRLTSIWTSAGDLTRLRELRLFRYMLVRSAAEREQLRRDILCGGELKDPTMREARYKILAALTQDGYEKCTYRQLALGGNGKGGNAHPGPQKQATVDDYEGSSDEYVRGRPKASDTVSEPSKSRSGQLLLEYGSKVQEASGSDVESNRDNSRSSNSRWSDSRRSDSPERLTSEQREGVS
ncbi:hypothetical protein NKR19_g7699 [Coniochaeta hoffmannii]|uniref:Uncharacterized protein n=1 Tax=Coniochaeta hoffmannii TaxID=91930 RepID=A0AA38RTR7_9PEZI|nr:hypothetical protein NKR19_g7699 [Coniochaeta hoffmannii]